MDRLGVDLLGFLQFLAPRHLGVVQSRALGLDHRQRAGLMAQGCRQLGQGRAGVADDADIDWIALADLLRVQIDLDQLRAGDVEGVLGPPGAAVRLAEGCADGQDDVGRARRVIGDARAPDAGRAQRQGVVLGEDALTHQGGGHRRTQLFRQNLQGVIGAGQSHAVAGEDHRIGRGLQHGDGLGHALGVAHRTSEVGTPRPRLGLGRNLLGEDIHRDVQQHGAGPACLGDVQGPVHDVGQMAGVVHAPDPLADRLEDVAL
ncbi:hypothetical protein D3C86_364100 [compost metagenome]